MTIPSKSSSVLKRWHFYKYKKHFKDDFHENLPCIVEIVKQGRFLIKTVVDIKYSEMVIFKNCLWTRTSFYFCLFASAHSIFQWGHFLSWPSNKHPWLTARSTDVPPTTTPLPPRTSLVAPDRSTTAPVLWRHADAPSSSAGSPAPAFASTPP